MPSPDLESGIIFARQSGLVPLVLVIDFSTPRGQLEELLRRDEIVAAVPTPDPNSASAARSSIVGQYRAWDVDWPLPKRQAKTLLFVGPRENIGLRTIASAWVSGVRTIIYWDYFNWAYKDAMTLAFQRATNRVTQVFWTRLWAPSMAWFDKGTRTTGSRVDPEDPRDSHPGNDPAGWCIRLEDRLIGQAARTVLAEAAEPLLPLHAFHADRVMLFNTSLAAGGAERQIVNTLVGLVERGYDDVVFRAGRLEPADVFGFFAPQLRSAGIDVGVLEYNALDRLGISNEVLERLNRQIQRIPSQIRDPCAKAIGELAHHRPQVVHAWQDETAIVVAIAANIVGVPRVVLSCRNLSPSHFAYHHHYMRPFYRVLAQTGKAKLSNNSVAGAHDYARWLRIPADDIAVIRNGFIPPEPSGGQDLANKYLNELGYSDSPPVVGSIFRFYPEKRGVLWIRVAAAIARQRPDVRFVLVGDGIQRSEMMREVSRWGIGDRVHFLGERRDGVQWLTLMSVFLLASRFEGLPNVLLEAQAFGVPIVALDAGGAAETFVDGKSGWLLEGTDIEEIANRVIWCLDNRKWSQDASKAGREFVASHFGIARMINETLSLYGWVPTAQPPENGGRHSW